MYAMLAVGSHMSSWEGPGGRGFEGRLLALKFKEQALVSNIQYRCRPFWRCC